MVKLFTLSVLLLASSVLGAQIPQGLSGAWRFEEAGSGIIKDFSGNNSDGILLGSPSACDGYISAGLELDGFDDYINAPSFTMNTQNAAFSAWINTQSIPNWWVSVINTHKASGKCGLAFYKNQNQLAYYWNDSKYSFDSGLEIPLNQWVFIAVVIEPERAVLYVKPYGGQLEKSVNFDNHSFCSLKGVMIGRDSAPGWGDGERRFQGRIDEVRIYSRSLSESEVIRLSDMERCWNYPPRISVSDAQIAYAGKPRSFSCSFQDDGRPFIEGCDNLMQGTSFQKTFYWSKVSGTGSVSFTAPYKQTSQAVFSEPGNYQIKIDVSDGPSGIPEQIHGKTGSVFIDVEVLSEEDKQLLADYRFQQQPDEDAPDSAGENDLAQRMVFGLPGQNWCEGPENSKAAGFMPGENTFYEIQPSGNSQSELADIKEAAVSAWIMPLAGSPEGGRVCFSAKNSSGKVFTIEGTSTLSNSKWHHIAAVYDAVQGQMLVYVNGVLDAAKDIPPSALSSDWYEPLIASGYSEQRENFAGCIDKLQIFNYALSRNEVVSLMECSELVFAGLSAEADISGRLNSPDCRVDLFDYALLADSWLSFSPVNADITGDSAVNISDLALLAESWLSCKDPQDPRCLQYYE
ncbi:hypothetical protein L21SP3_00323 [Sedimentisphaera cyanobacteriorum]|uniref:LamG-like jellyroll fold domain-containing protein n=1 Tax=Sedimentisphaera cyanobacteriorum TaxID=1940790 RepID=A0A1Q2HLW1_9BACT|nr:LamG-like jellyroll fold domain-containing protein [Sedimentisphaera cyanobacteriorum]AQQ08539.1 hypothetical protein L21SP3_00323 [Sedimentisphaera cyanobacteriorum]